MIIIHSIVYVWQYYARACGENKLYVIAGILATIVNFSFVIIFVVIIKLGLLGLLLAYIFGQFSIIIIIERKIGVIRNLEINDFDFGILKKMLIFSSPLVLNLISAWLISGFGRLIITVELGTEANGFYSFANKFALVITMVGTVITMAIIEEAILSFKSKEIDSNFNKTIESLFKIFQSFALISVPVIVLFYTTISDTEYYTSLVYAPWLMLYAIANTMASNMGSIFQAINKTKYQFLTTVLGAVVTVVISVYTIKTLGITGVIIGQILGAITMLISRYLLINKFIIMKIRWIPIIFRTLLFIAVVLVCLNTHFIISLIVEILLLGILGYLNRRLLNRGWHKIKTKVVKR